MKFEPLAFLVRSLPNEKFVNAVKALLMENPFYWPLPHFRRNVNLPKAKIVDSTKPKKSPIPGINLVVTNLFIFVGAPS